MGVFVVVDSWQNGQAGRRLPEGRRPGPVRGKDAGRQRRPAPTHGEGDAQTRRLLALPVVGCGPLLPAPCPDVHWLLTFHRNHVHSLSTR